MRYFDVYCPRYEFIFIGPKRLLKTQIFEKKGKLPSEEKILGKFSRIVECDKSQETICKG